MTSALHSGKDLYYRGSVVEMYPRGSVSFSPMLNINMTIDAMETYIRRASEEDTADIIVFPEAILWTFGLVAPGNSTMSPRDRLAQYGETLPPVGTLPCNDASVHNNFLVSVRISCLAKKYSISVVVNTVDVRPCSPTTDHSCPHDRRYQFNTDVVFDGQKGGIISAVYHKYHLFGTYPLLNYPKAPEVVKFHSSFGVTFGLFVCFDISFSHPVQNLLEDGVRHFLFSTWWYNSAPLFTATMFQQAFSRKFNSVLLAANTGSSYLNSGSGIYWKGNVLQSHYNSSTFNQDVYMVAEIPKTLRAVDDTQPQLDHNNIEMKRKESYYDNVHSNRYVLPCSYESPGLVTSGYCTPLDVFGVNWEPKRSIQRHILVPETNFTCYLDADVVPGKRVKASAQSSLRYSRITQTSQYVLFANQGEYNYSHTMNVTGTNISLLVQTCAVFLCDIAGSSLAKSTNRLACKNVFDASVNFSKIKVRGTFVPESTQYSMLAFGKSADLIRNASEIRTSTGFMEWASGSMIKKGPRPLFSATIYGLSQHGSAIHQNPTKVYKRLK